MSGTLSEYELLRLRNIKRNHEFLKSLGLPVPAVPAGLPSRPRKTPAKKRKTTSVQSQDGESSNESSDDSDEDWVPGSEEVRKRKKMIKRFIPDFRPRPQTVPVLKRRKESSKVVEGEENCTSAFDELGRLGEEMDFFTEDVPVSEKGRKKTKSADKQLPKTRSQYATRGKKHSYCEPEVPDDDHYIYCEDCQDLHYDDCPVHGPMQTIDDRTDKENSNMSPAVASLPEILEISQSSIPEAGLGVFSTSEIPKGARFGPYKGKKTGWEHITDETNTSYMWEIVKDGKFSHFVDGRDEKQGNWMRFVNCSRCEDEQNLVAYQFRGEIFYRTYKSISPGKELLVWYGESYAKDLGISLNDDKQQSNTKDGIYTCDGCERMYTSLNFLQRHKKYYCSTRTMTKLWECNTCGKKFASLCNLNNHIRTHTDEKKYQYKRGDKVCSESVHRTKHLRTHTGEKPYQCTQCNKAFNQLCNLTTHLRTHTGEKPYHCTQCNKAFSGSNDLTRHLRTHTGEKPYQCTQCNKAFNRLGNLTTHLRTHTGEKPYHCSQCNKAFSGSNDLTKHLRTHTGEKPYQCTQCNKAFRYMHHLTQHIRTHTGEKPYQCTQCQKAFRFSNELTRHLSTHTGEKP